MPKFFKTRFVPNPDGTDSATAITNVNTAFVHSYVGDDLTGDGTREFPFKSAYKANQKSGVTYIVFRGVINEAFSTTKTIIGDDVNQLLIASNYTINYSSLYNLTIDVLGRFTTSNCSNLIIKNSSTFNLSGNNYNSSLFLNGFYSAFFGGDCLLTNLTIRNSSFLATQKNNILLGVLDVKINMAYQFVYTLFLSTTIFKFNGNAVAPPIWTNDSKVNIQLIRNAYLTAGMTQANVDLLFIKDSFGNETCRIVKEARNGGASANIFNQYDVNGNVLDYTLNPDSANEALYASDLGSYVGCFKPASPVNAISGNTLNAPVNVLADGTDEAVAGTLVLNTSDVLSFATGQAQIWNRVKSANTIVIPNGIKFNGVSSMSTDGTPFGYYFGKFQNLMDGTPINPGDALEANTIYKVHNLTRTIFEAILFNGNQYLPDYFFKTGAAPLVYSLLNAGSGTVVKKVLATPFESIEIIPYDDAVTPSATFPKFSCPMFGNCLMLFHKIGANIDKPVLFSEVANDKIACYDTFAVTNADLEFNTLASDTVNYYYAIPVLKYLRIEINGHFNADYDQ